MSTAVTAATTAARWNAPRWYEWLIWIGLWCAAIFLPRGHLLLNQISIFALFAISLDLILGYAGIVSLGHAVFLGVGAYSAALFANHYGVDPLIGLLIAAGFSAVLGFLSSTLIIRGSDLTRLMVTLGIALLLYELANKLAWLTGGADGMGVDLKPILGRFEFDLFGRVACYYSLAVLTICFFLMRRMVHSPFGMSLQAIRENRLRATSMGMPVRWRIMTIYTIAGAIGGLAGGLLAQTTGFVSLDALGFHHSADALLILIIGGAGYLYGGLIGAIAFILMREVLSGWTPQYWQFWVGFILVIIVLIGRERIQKSLHIPALLRRTRNKGAA